MASGTTANSDWLEAAYPEYIDSLKKYLRRFVESREEAEDLAHDAFLRVWASPNFDRGRETDGYLFTTARNLAFNWNKAHHVAKSAPDDALHELPDDGTSVERDAMTADEFRVLSKAMSRLPERRRDVLMLRAFFEYPCQDIADQLNISRTTVHRELARAIETIHAARKLIESEKRPVRFVGNQQTIRGAARSEVAPGERMSTKHGADPNAKPGAQDSRRDQ